MAIFPEVAKTIKRNVETFVANVDLSTSQYCAVVPVASSSGKCKVGLPSADGQLIMGILQNAPAAGEIAEVLTLGDSVWIAVGAFNNGIELMAESATGKAKAATSTNYVGAISKQAASAAGHQVAVEVRNYKI